VWCGQHLSIWEAREELGAVLRSVHILRHSGRSITLGICLVLSLDTPAGAQAQPELRTRRMKDDEVESKSRILTEGSKLGEKDRSKGETSRVGSQQNSRIQGA